MLVAVPFNASQAASTSAEFPWAAVVAAAAATLSAVVALVVAWRQRSLQRDLHELTTTRRRADVDVSSVAPLHAAAVLVGFRTQGLLNGHPLMLGSSANGPSETGRRVEQLLDECDAMAKAWAEADAHLPHQTRTDIQILVMQLGDAIERLRLGWLTAESTDLDIASESVTDAINAIGAAAQAAANLATASIQLLMPQSDSL